MRPYSYDPRPSPRVAIRTGASDDGGNRDDANTTKDAGAMNDADAGTMPANDAGLSSADGGNAEGLVGRCGCSSASLTPAVGWLSALLLGRRRRKPL